MTKINMGWEEDKDVTWLWCGRECAIAPPKCLYLRLKDVA